MNYYFEPVNLKKWNMFKKVKNIGHIESMLATSNMKMNDIVFLHVGTQEKTIVSGIYAIGIIVKEPYILRNHPDEYCNNKNTIDLKIIYIDYDKPLINTQKYNVFSQYRTVHKLSQVTLEKIRRIISSNVLEFMDKTELNNEVNSIEEDVSKSNFTVGEKEIIAKARIGQGKFKKLLLEKYDRKCCICNLSNIGLLVASHIKEWKNSNTYEKGDINNGLLLCTLHDSLFDKHLISFDKKGKIIFSKNLTEEDKKIMHLNDNICISISEDMEKYMNYHRNKI